mgnify:CR=1 FL=1
MAKRKRKSTAGRGRQRRRSRAQDRMPAGLVTLFLGLILMALAFVPGSAVWKTLHDALFGVFGCGSFVVGAALCYDFGNLSDALEFVPLSPKLETGTVLAWKKDQTCSPAADQFLGFLKNAL